jgi:SAM-dependent methyltransferase
LHLTQAEKVANFGCNIGGETLALMWLLQANEATGLDIEADNISQAQDTLQNLQEDVVQARRNVKYPWVSQEDRDWWSGAPHFFTHRILEQDFSLEYHIRDITKPTGLPDNHYDLAFCDFVLYHIWYDETREYAEQDTQFAISEMARVIKPGGLVAARELIQYDDKPRLAFSHLFETAGLTEVYIQEDEVEGLEGKGWVGKYVYRRGAWPLLAATVNAVSLTY